MTYTRISQRGKETFRDEREYQEKRAREETDAARREVLVAEGKKALALARTEDQIKAAYLADEITAQEMEEALNHLYGIEGGEHNGGEG